MDFLEHAEVGGQWALRFDGVNDYVNLGNKPSLQLRGDMTVCTWVKLGNSTAGQYMGIAGKMNANYEGFALARRDNNKFGFFIGCPEGLHICTASKTTRDSEWHHVAGVIKDGKPYLYVDGDLVWDAPLPWNNLQLGDSGEYAYIGRMFSNQNDRFFEGLIDDVCFYERGLSAQEVEAFLSDRPSTSDSAMVGYWAFEQSSGQIINDLSTRDNYGYLGHNALPESSDPCWVYAASEPPCKDEWSYFITFDSQSEYEAYVTTNNNALDYGDLHPVECIIDQQSDRLGMLQLQNLMDLDSKSTTYEHIIPARATLTFTDWPCEPRWDYRDPWAYISVAFDYRFHSSSGVLTVVVRNGTNQLHLSSLIAPDPELPGGSNSTAWGQYKERVTISGFLEKAPIRITLELRGTVNTQVMIDELITEAENYRATPYTPAIPKVRCISHCADIAGIHYYSVGPEDYLAALYSCDNNQLNWGWQDHDNDWSCVDSEFTTDGVISIEDVEYFAWVDAYPAICSCGDSPNAALSSVKGLTSQLNELGCEPNAPLLVAGKMYTYDPYNYEHSFMADRIFGFECDYSAVGEPLTWGDERLNTRLVKDNVGGLYQLNVIKGLVRLSNGQSVLPRSCLPYDGNDVVIGWNKDKGSPPLQDVTFDASGDVYVVPVLIIQPAGESYRAAARIRLGASPGENSVVQLYKPLFASGVHEIEMDHTQKVYILDKGKWDLLGNNLRCYNRDSGLIEDRMRLGYYVKPEAFHVSKRDGQIFVVDGGYTLTQMPSLHSETREVQIRGMDYVTDITEDTDTGTIWLVGYRFESWPGNTNIRNGTTVVCKPGFMPCLAKIPRDSSGPIDAVIVSDYEISGTGHLSLPLSIIYTGNGN